MKKLPWYKKCIGYIIPIVTTHHTTDRHPDLKVKYYQGQWQLESEDALYSDGHRYAPFRLAYNYLHEQKKLSGVQSFLLLGAGLGSALLRLQKVYNIYPHSTLVEYDEDIIELGQIYFDINQKKNVEYIHADAAQFLNKNHQQFDLIGVDIFEGIVNSDLLRQGSFLILLTSAMNKNSQLIINSIFTKNKARANFEQLLEHYFTFECLERNPNYIYILQLK